MPAAESPLPSSPASWPWFGREKQIKFLLVGGWNTVFGYSVFLAFYALTSRLGLHYLVAMVLAQAVAITNAYLAYRKLVFKSRGAIGAESLRFGAVYAYTFAFNAAALPLLVHRAHFNPAAAQALIVLVSAFVSWFAHSRWSFRDKPVDPCVEVNP